MNQWESIQTNAPIQKIHYREEGRKKGFIDVLFSNDDILAVAKPAGLLVIPDRYNPDRANLRDILQHVLDRELWVVHRLDAETSGVIIFAGNAKTHRELSIKFEKSEINKIYLALVKGVPPLSEGVIDVPLSLNTNHRPKMVIDGAGKPSRTNYRLLETFGQYSLMEARPVTGRMHQIRIHFAHLGTPLAFDPIYGSKQPIMLSGIKRNYHFSTRKEEMPLIDRLTLHAFQISFALSPEELYCFTAELPKDFRNTIRAMRKWLRK
jgi:23S rRNA pseudouridine955/2504/2580 synthase/23S rRNA pseudouridine1911/1915/1917 synthase